MGERPNVIAIVLDDTGFGQLGCFGGPTHTPRIDALASEGVRYRRFHVTAMCSPTRASLLTGRNHHRVGYGFLADLPLQHPSYSARIPQSVPTLPEVLRDEGYFTFAVGKWHLTPRWERSPGGPYDTWPLQRGFSRFYGFLQGDTNQFAPNLVCDNHYLDPPKGPNDGYHLTEDLVDQARRLILESASHAPGKPFFGYVALGAMHAPHHVAGEYSDRYAGAFDDGWNHLREATLDRQRQLGVVPEGTELSEWPDWVRSWPDVPEHERPLLARQQEIFSGFLTHTDEQIGRLLDVLEETGIADSTIVLLLSDNGASAEGGVHGLANEHEFTGGDASVVHEEWLDRWGGVETYPHYSWGWAFAGNAPFPLWKRYTWLGGTRCPLIIRYPKGTAVPGRVSDAFVHASDLMPTILELAGIDMPSDRLDPNDLADGASIAPTLSGVHEAGRTTQYFELLGSRSIIDLPYKATTDHVSDGVPDEERLMVGSRDFATDRWALFNLDEDFSESEDLATQHPEIVQRLSALWDAEAERNGVLPLSDSILGRAGDLVFGKHPPASTMRYIPESGPIRDEALPFIAFGFTMLSEFELTKPEGVVFALGDLTGGFALFLDHGRARFSLATPNKLSSVASDDVLQPGLHQVIVRYRPGDDVGQISIEVDATPPVTQSAPPSLPIVFQHGGAALRLGFDVGLPVDQRYVPSAALKGDVRYCTVSADPSAVPELLQSIETALRSD